MCELNYSCRQSPLLFGHDQWCCLSLAPKMPQQTRPWSSREYSEPVSSYMDEVRWGGETNTHRMLGNSARFSQSYLRKEP